MNEPQEWIAIERQEAIERFRGTWAERSVPRAFLPLALEMMQARAPQLFEPVRWLTVEDGPDVVLLIPVSINGGAGVTYADEGGLRRAITDDEIRSRARLFMTEGQTYDIARRTNPLLRMRLPGLATRVEVFDA